MNRQQQQTSGEPSVDRLSREEAEIEIDSLPDAEQANNGRGWHGNSEGHAAAGSKGGHKVSQDRDHMANIGRKGGQAVSRDRLHMASIGRKGGQARTESGSAERENESARQDNSQ